MASEATRLGCKGGGTLSFDVRPLGQKGNMLRRLFNLCSLLSFVLAILLCALWVRSYWSTDRLRWQSMGGSRMVQTASGHLMATVLLADWSTQPLGGFVSYYEQAEPGRPFNYLLFLCHNVGTRFLNWEAGGFAWHSQHRPDGVVNFMAYAPFWGLALVAGLLPAGWAMGRWRGIRRIRRRELLGFCTSCGYDLRASSGRCSECGSSYTGATHHPSTESAH
jgi:hypothetical protein